MKIGLYKVTSSNGKYGIAHDIKDVPFLPKPTHYIPVSTAAQRDKDYCRMVAEVWKRLDAAMRENPKLQLYEHVSSENSLVIRLRAGRRSPNRRR